MKEIFEEIQKQLPEAISPGTFTVGEIEFLPIALKGREILLQWSGKEFGISVSLVTSSLGASPEENYGGLRDAFLARAISILAGPFSKD